VLYIPFHEISFALASPEDRKELFHRYQLKMKDFKGKKSPIGKSTPSKPTKNMIVCAIITCIHRLDI
jgi:hypothetical protein